MRWIGWTLLVFLAVPIAADEEEGVVTNEELNFYIKMPDSIDWKVEKIDEAEDKRGLKAHFSTEFVDLGDGSRADVNIWVIPMSSKDTRSSVEKLAIAKQNDMESFLENPHDRKMEKTTFGKADAVEVDVKGIHTTGNFHRTWVLSRMGKYIYIFVADRWFKAIGDEDLEDEIKEARDSFKFLEERKIAKHKEGGKAGKGPGGPAGSVKKAEDIDPELLKEETIQNDFWRFKCIKPTNILRKKVTAEDLKRGTRLKFERRIESGYVMIEVLVQSKATARYTIEQLADQYEKYFKDISKKMKEPVVDTKYKKKFPLAKKALKVDFVGRSKTGVVVKQTWILADCSNDRQYQLRIYTHSGGDRAFKKQIAEFLKSFEVFKRPK